MKIEMTENRIQLEPQIPESLLNICLPINFEHRVSKKEGAGQLLVTIEPDKKKISVDFKSNNFGPKPDILSNSYSIT
jgi:hypothetical protein